MRDLNSPLLGTIYFGLSFCVSKVNSYRSMLWPFTHIKLFSFCTSRNAKFQFLAFLNKQFKYVGWTS